MAFTSEPSFWFPLIPRRVAGAGTHWVSVQANQKYGTTGQWGWRDRTVTSNAGVRLAEPQRRLPTAALHGLGATGNDVQHRSSGARPGLQAPRNDGPASASATATTSASATAAAAGACNGPGDHDP